MPLNHTQDQAEYRTTTDDRDFWTKDPRSVLRTRISGGKGESWLPPRVYQTTQGRRAMKGEAVGHAREMLRDTWAEEAGSRGPGHYIEDVSAVAFEDRKIDTSISRPGSVFPTSSTSTSPSQTKTETEATLRQQHQRLLRRGGARERKRWGGEAGERKQRVQRESTVFMLTFLPTYICTRILNSKVLV